MTTPTTAPVDVPVPDRQSRVDLDVDGVRWPVVDGIAWRRPGREELRAEAVRLLDDGDVHGARTALLADNDDWWTGGTPPPERLARVPGAATLREALDLLGAGPVGDYFLHRWSDPTYLAALALLRAHWPGDGPVVDAACGAGHLLRELALRGVRDLVGVDVVFAKLWLAQRFVCPGARYVCADLTALPFDLLPSGGATALCVDALYFVRDKEAAVAGLRRVAGSDGQVVVGHAHTPAEELGAGLPLPVEGWRALLEPGGSDAGDVVAYDDAELTAALLDDRPPTRLAPSTTSPAAVALVVGLRISEPGPDLGVPPEGRPLRLNPLYDADGVLRPPNERWAAEYAGVTAYLPARVDPDTLPPDAARRRVLLDLPEDW